MSDRCSRCGDVERHGCLAPVECPFKESLKEFQEFLWSPRFDEAMKALMESPEEPTMCASVYAMQRIALTLPKMHAGILRDLQKGKFNWVTEKDLQEDFGLKPLPPGLEGIFPREEGGENG
jgi:hypothetical protein